MYIIFAEGKTYRLSFLLLFLLVLMYFLESSCYSFTMAAA